VVITNFPVPQAKQIVFAHDPADSFVVHLPAAPFQLGGDAPAPIGRPLQGDLLDLIAQIYIPIRRFGRSPVAIKPRPADRGHFAHFYDAHGRFPFDLFFDLLVDGAVP
jgi:hypothetical protein